MARQKQPTIQEVSRRSGVSVATVSRVLHGESGRFSPDTEKKVREAMAELNYAPDLLAQGMRRRTLPVVGVVMPDILDDNMALMMRTVQQVLFERNYSTVFFNSDESCEKTQRYLDLLHAQHAAGVIYVPDRDYRPMHWHGMPSLCFDRVPPAPDDGRAVMIVQNNTETAAQVIRWMAESGCRSVALLGDRYGIPMHDLRMKGAMDEIAARNLTLAGVLRVDPQKTTEAVRAMTEALEEGMRFDGIFCTSVRLTVGAMSALKANDLLERVKVAGYGEHRLHRYGLIDDMAVYEPIREKSLAAAHTMLELISGGEVPCRQVFEARCLAEPKGSTSS